MCFSALPFILKKPPAFQGSYESCTDNQPHRLEGTAKFYELWTPDIKTWPQEDIRRHPTTWSSCLLGDDMFWSVWLPFGFNASIIPNIRICSVRAWQNISRRKRRMVGTSVTLAGLVLACHPGHPSKETWASNSHHPIHMCKDMIKVVILVAAGPIFGWSEKVDVQRVIWGVTLQILGHSLQDIRSQRSTWRQFERSPLTLSPRVRNSHYPKEQALTLRSSIPGYSGTTCAPPCWSNCTSSPALK